MTPRYYQTEFVEAVLKAWGETAGATETYRKIVGVLPTSAGKTICAAFLFQFLVKNKFRPLFLGDTDELCMQPLAKIHKATGIICGLEKADSRAPLGAEAVVGSLQSMSMESRLARFPKDHFSHIIIDEAHRNPTLHQKVIAHFENAKVLGITATAFRQNMKDLSAYYDFVAYKMEMFDMIEAGFMPPINVMTLPIDIDIANVKQSRSKEGSDYNAGELESVIRPYYEAIGEQLIEKCSLRQIVAFLPLIQSSKEFVSAMTGKGISARHVDGSSPDRQEILAAFERKMFKLLSNSQVVSTGWDCVTVDALLNLRPTRSVGLFRQMAGRTVRVLPGVIDHLPEKDQAAERRAAIAASDKPNALILDLLWQTEKFGLTGAAALMSQSEDDARAITEKIRAARDPESLQGIMDDFREEKESQLIRELERAAKRKAMFIDARQLGVLLHQPDLDDYEPVFGWEKKGISEKQASILERNGVDPSTVTSRGHASKILDEIFTRKSDGRASIPTIRALIKEGIGPEAEITEQRAVEILGVDGALFPFGKWSGQPMSAVSDGYWRWLEKQNWFNARSHPAAHAYMVKKLNLSPVCAS